VLVLDSGDSVELIEPAAANNGAFTRIRFLFKAGGLRVPAHRHLEQDETFEVLSGTLGYTLRGKEHRAVAGSTVTLPRGIMHQHYSAAPDDTVVIQTMRPGLDFDYIAENLFGLGTEGRGIAGFDSIIQGLVWVRKMKGPFYLGAPLWLQRLLAALVTPIAYRFGYRAVYKRFSGEEW
jgi:quercetin dioxygenase-like cupin family protein